VKLVVLSLTREVPVVVYVDKAAEKAILGSLFIKGENMTRKESGEPKPRKLDMAKFEMDKSPSRGPSEAKVTIVEFSNFECPYCVKSWEKIVEFMEKSPKDVRYVFKHFPFQGPGKTAELSELAAAAQELGNDAFWLVHDFLFSKEGQAMVKGDKKAVRKKLEGLLKEKGFDLAALQTALEKGSARKRVEEDIALGKNYQIRGTPTTIINGEMQMQALTDKVLDQYMGK
jgi:protein-disulfide isomerase